MKKGTIVHIDYDLYNAETETLLETTREDVAKEHDAHDERRTYKPMITVIGDGRLIKGFEEHLDQAKEKEEGSQGFSVRLVEENLMQCSAHAPATKG